MIRPVPDVSDRDNFRIVPVTGMPGFTTPKRDPVEPVPVGSYVAAVFRVTGYNPDCDGSLLARLESVSADGEATGWEPDHLGLYPGTEWQLDGPADLDRVPAALAAAVALAEDWASGRPGDHSMLTACGRELLRAVGAALAGSVQPGSERAVPLMHWLTGNVTPACGSAGVNTTDRELVTCEACRQTAAWECWS